MRRNQFDEEEYQEEGADFANLLEEERQHWSAVKKRYDQIDSRLEN